MGALLIMVASNEAQDWECRSLFSKGEIGEMLKLQQAPREGSEMADESIPLNSLPPCQPSLASSDWM